MPRDDDVMILDSEAKGFRTGKLGIAAQGHVLEALGVIVFCYAIRRYLSASERLIISWFIPP